MICNEELTINIGKILLKPAGTIKLHLWRIDLWHL